MLYFQVSSQQFEWANAVGGTLSDQTNGIAVDNNGNVISVGRFQGTMDLDPGTGTSSVSTSGGTDHDAFIYKVDANGSYQWGFSIGNGEVGAASGGPEQINAVEVDNSGNIYITGVFTGIVDFDPSSNVFNLSSTCSSCTPGFELYSRDAFWAKYDTNGNFIAAFSWGSTGYDQGLDITLAPNGDVYIVGQYEFTVDFDPSGTVQNGTSNGGHDIFVVGYNTSNQLDYLLTFGSTDAAIFEDNGTGVDVDASGNVYVTGFFRGNMNLNPNGTATNVSAGGRDAFLAKYNSSGILVWGFDLGANSTDESRDCKLDASDNIYITGTFTGSVDFDPSAGTAGLTSFNSGNDDVFIAKYSSLGVYEWAFQIGSVLSNESGNSIAVDDESIYVGGVFRGTNVNFDPNGSYPLSANSSINGFVASYDFSGNFIWAGALTPSTTTGSEALAIDVNSNDEVALGGLFAGTADFDIESGTANLTSNGNLDAFSSKYISVCVPNIITPNETNLPDLMQDCSLTPTSPTATTNCGILLTATSNLTFPIYLVGERTITWTYDDGNGNTLTQEQTIIIEGTDTDTDGICDAGDTDDDNDGVPDGEDLDPLDPSSCRDLDSDTCDDCSSGTDDPSNDGTDNDADGMCDAGDPDDDNDGIPDVADPAPLDPFICGDSDSDTCDDCSSGTSDPSNDGLDTDSDGICDAGDTDDDNDGIADSSDIDPLDPTICGDADADTCDDCSQGVDGFGPLADNTPGNDGTDTDTDGMCDAGDEDDDNDGTPDSEDAFPLDPTEFFDGDGDGVGSNADCDDDNSTVFPDALELNDDLDNDCDGMIDEGFEVCGDGIVEGFEECDDGNSDSGDGCDFCTLETDSDSDGVMNMDDNCPFTSNPDQMDTDADGVGDVCDTCPNDASAAQLDTDGDGMGDDCDTDDDNDGIEDGLDLDPLDPNICTDADSDGCDDCSVGVDGFGPQADNNANNDGLDTDADGVCDASDTDDDNDGVLDTSDLDPLDPMVCIDANNDGCDDCATGVDGFGPLADNVGDVTDPIPNQTTLPDITQQCEVISIAIPTATDDCAGMVEGTANVSFPITAQGTTVVTWTFTDETGNSTTQQQNVTLTDDIAPIPNVANLPVIFTDCNGMIQSITAPLATDNCRGMISATTNQVFPFIPTADSQILWEYEDGNGNTTIQFQDVTIIRSDTVSLEQTLCEGADFIFPDGTVWTGETSQLSTLTNEQGCDSLITTNVTVSPLPIVDLGEDIVFGCVGEDLTFSIDESSISFETYTISTLFGISSTNEPLTFNFDQAFAATAAIQDVFVTIELYNANGCVGTDEVLLEDNTMTNWGIGSIQNNDPEIVVSNTFLPETADTFEWDFGDGSTNTEDINPTYIYSENGDYTITLKVSNDCGNESLATSVSITGVTDPLGVDTKDMLVYPNPTSDFLILDFHKPIQVYLYSLDGKMVMRALVKSEQKLDLSLLKNGQYILKMFSDDQLIGTEKILKVN